MPNRHEWNPFYRFSVQRLGAVRSASKVKNSWPVFFLGCAIAAAVLSGCEKKEEAAKPTPPEVLVADVSQQNVPIFEEWVAQLNGPVNADITPKVQGYLLRQNYQNGYFVKKGQLLFELDPRQYQADVDKAQADLERTQAQVARFEADVARDTPLAAQNAIPQKQLDTDHANLAAAQAQILADKAALDNAKLNLAWTKVYSPIDGVAGDAKSQIGDLVGTTTKMATVSEVNPIWANFNISESAYLGQAVKISQFIRTGKAGTTAVEYIQANGEVYPQTGHIIQVNREISSSTGTIQVTAAFPNPDALLRPGGFGRVRIQTSNNKDALLVPQPAIIEVQSQYQIIVVTPEHRAMFRPIKVGQRVGSNWIVTEGLKPGEKVVVEGIQKLQLAAAANPQFAKEGVPVIAKPYQATTASAAGSN
ncbi:MAG TPA: efflux RND transporter periplasmic adaptor subunit [Candidatus Binatia bacterium]|nr:efflux RND transporter periplasmic adaptor subunit [Candidatus Binatia bacterium]